MIFTPRPRISIKLRVSSYAYMHIFRWFEIKCARIFYELLGIFYEPGRKNIRPRSNTSFTSLMLLDIDECSNGSHDCDVNANCTNTDGSHSCTCKEGYTGKGESCQGKIRLDLQKREITVHHK